MKEFSRAGVIIKKDDSYLFMKRIKNEKIFYAVIGGRPDEGESPEETAIREVQEETGLIITLKPESFICDAGMRSGYYMSPEYFFWADTIDGNPELGGEEKEFNNPDNLYELVWIKEADLASIELLPTSIHQYLLKHS